MPGNDFDPLSASHYAASASDSTHGKPAKKFMDTARFFEESPAMRAIRESAATARFFEESPAIRESAATARFFEESPAVRAIRESAATARFFEESPAMRAIRESAATARLLEESAVMQSFRETAQSVMAAMYAFGESGVMERFQLAGEAASIAARTFSESEIIRHICSKEAALRTFATSKAVKQLRELPTSGGEADCDNNTSHGQVPDERATAPAEEKLIIESISHSVLALLKRSPEAIHLMPPEKLEELVFERFHALGFNVERAGATNTPDGGVDLIACPKNAGPLPYLVAVQVKHKRGGKGSIGGPVVREFAGAMLTLGFKAGMVVTNASFTSDAEWVAKQQESSLLLRDMEDLKKWMQDDFGREVLWQALPDRIQVRPGFWVRVPRPNL